MAEDSAHKATLYFLEVLMNSTTPLSIGQLAGHFVNRSFTQEMRFACGGNDAGLKKFLMKYPSLFSVVGNLVSQNDGTLVSSGGTTPHESSPARALHDVSTETEAVNYFRDRLLKKHEMWVPIKSLAGHLSQASENIRNCVGPQSDFCKWLLKHPLIFEMKDDDVSLRRNEYEKMLKDSGHMGNGTDFPTKTTRFSGDFTARSFSQIEKKRRPQSLHVPKDAGEESDSSSMSSGKAGPTPMTASEYKAVIFIKNTLEEVGCMKCAALNSVIPENLRASVGNAVPDIVNFLKNHGSIFILTGDEVSLKRNARLNVIITGSRPPEITVQPTMKTGKGMVYHVTKLWAIIDLGKHEHVFIDRQILGRDGFDLTQLLAIGEMVCFNAIAAQKGSRARWRATQVWKEDESIEELLDRVAAKLNINLDKPSTEPSTPLGSIDDQIRKIIPEFDSDFMSPSEETCVFEDAAPSGAGVIPVWNYQNEFDALEKIRDISLDDSYELESPTASMAMMAERHIMNQSVLNDSPMQVNGSVNGLIKSADGSEDGASSSSRKNSCDNSASSSAVKDKPAFVSLKTRTTCAKCSDGSVKKTQDAGCQTIVTGEILATQLFHNPDIL